MENPRELKLRPLGPSLRVKGFGQVMGARAEGRGFTVRAEGFRFLGFVVYTFPTRGVYTQMA